jgi:hypothetical protein
MKPNSQVTAQEIRVNRSFDHNANCCHQRAQSDDTLQDSQNENAFQGSPTGNTQ